MFEFTTFAVVMTHETHENKKKTFTVRMQWKSCAGAVWSRAKQAISQDLTCRPIIPSVQGKRERERAKMEKAHIWRLKKRHTTQVQKMLKLTLCKTRRWVTCMLKTKPNLKTKQRWKEKIEPNTAVLCQCDWCCLENALLPPMKHAFVLTCQLTESLWNQFAITWCQDDVW